VVRYRKSLGTLVLKEPSQSSMVYQFSMINQTLFIAGPQPEGWQSGNLPPPRNFHKRMYLLGAATSYIILPPPRKYQLVAALVYSVI